MPRRALAIVTACLVLIAAIVAGYWHMLTTEKSRLTDLAANEAGGESEVPGLASANEPADVASAGEKTSRAKEASADPEESVSPLQEAVTASADADTPLGERLAATGAEAQPGAEITPEKDAEAAKEKGDPQTADFSQTPRSSETATAKDKPSSSTTDAQSSPTPADLPTFDVLRVEPDGSMVVAGHGPANAMIRLENGDKTLGTERTDAAGDFVVVLSENLAPGPYAVKIVAETNEGEPVVSAETAIIDIPEPGRNEQLLAMVEAPDAPSRLLELPKAEDEPAGAGNASRSPADSQTAEVALSQAPSKPATSETSTSLAMEPPESKGSTGDLASSKTEDPSAPPASNAARPSGETGAASEADGSGTALLRRDDPTPASDSAEPSVSLRVEAVEIDGDKIFVAGEAPAGATVRVYLDNKLLAEDRVSPTNRFLAQTSASIPVGDYMVRADQLDRGGDVVSRVEVPFLRPAGTTLSAVAPKPSADFESAQAPNKARTVQNASVQDEAPSASDDRQVVEGHASNGAFGTQPERSAKLEMPASGQDRDASSTNRSKTLASAETEAGSSQAPVQSAARQGAGQASDSAGEPISPAQAVATIEQDAPDSDTSSASASSVPAALSPSEPRSISVPTPANDAAAATPSQETNDSQTDSQPVIDVPTRNGSNATVSNESRDVAEVSSEPGSAAPAQSGTTGGRETDAASRQATPASGEVSETETSQPSASSTPAQTEAVMSQDQGDASGDGAETLTAALEDSVPTISQAPLQSATGRVIIRKGDTLWQISRDSYGSGSRYTVIYLANGDQIRDPNRIYPGQVFRMPPGEEQQAEDSGQAPQ
ncbi:LysM domain-containing protein [Fulvimarina manganoxydans]|uniref:LysM domain-containing protein n=1 Tax=Fulvimarina manganoxydans TaxID=937218 RepID=A0A1W1ZPX4_9HYPH|nr:LysM peptidoglycan-binding domain-containing protein [Fulvimarina manganoxydans]SMC50454.1 LysM domain-containing protein [Fulvimarina manganoxydans]